MGLEHRERECDRLRPCRRAARPLGASITQHTSSLPYPVSTSL
jgi:hypothetical protein